MNGTALYRALVEAGASEERAREAAESVVYAREGATRTDIADVVTKVAEVKSEVADVRAEVAGVRIELAEVKSEVADVRTEVAEVRTEVADVRIELAHVKTELSDRIAALEVSMERGFRSMTLRLVGVFFALQALMLAALRFTFPA